MNLHAHKNFKFVIIYFCAFTLYGCNSYTNSELEFKRLATSWVKAENTVAEAKAVLEEKGFKASRQPGMKKYKEGRDYLYATLSEFYFPVCNIEWRIIMPVSENKITEVDPMIFYTCL